MVHLHNLDTLSDEEIYFYLGEPRQAPIVTVTGAPPGPTAPKYGVVKANLTKFGLEHLTDILSIADFLDSFSVVSPPESITTTLGYTAPETQLERKISRSSDIWSLGCTLFELRMLQQLFPAPGESGDIVLQRMVETLGKPPENQWQKWKKRSKYFPKGALLPDHSQHEALLEKLIRRSNKIVLEDEVIKRALSETEVRFFADLLGKMLRYEPRERIIAIDALQHPWLEGGF